MSWSQPNSGPMGSRKRKERAHQGTETGPTAQPVKPVFTAPQQPASAGGNWLLAGYLAHEFLTKGTLLGRPPEQRRRPRAAAEKSTAAYDDVAYLLKTDGAHVAGVVNPSQLALWLQM
ncbi:uncharacterized protein LOC144710240 [Wolffia australiana]